MAATATVTAEVKPRESDSRQKIEPRRSMDWREGLPVGTSCLFYRGGRRQDGPIAATVLANEGNGILTLNIHEFGRIDGKQSVRHVDDPYLITHTDVRQRDGSWGYILPQ